MYQSLSDLKQCPLFQPQRMMHIKVNDLLKQLNSSRGENDTQRTPEGSALRFYTMNHVMAMVRNDTPDYEPLEGWKSTLYTQYLTEVASQTSAMLYYLFYIVTRELRHLHDDSKIDMLKEQNPIAMRVWARISSLTSTQVISYLKTLPFTDTDDVVAYSSQVAHVFHNGKFSKGYGGKAWGNIADVLSGFFSGLLSAEMLLDQAYHLAHNNGAIFNKGMVFQMYNATNLRLILDLQRAGQIPNLVTHNYSSPTDKGELIPSSYLKDVTPVLQGIPLVFDPINWLIVQESKPEGNYIAHIQNAIKAEKQAVPDASPTTAMDNSLKTIQVYAGKFVTAFTKDREILPNAL